jgi:hypothetical protein
LLLSPWMAPPTMASSAGSSPRASCLMTS